MNAERRTRNRASIFFHSSRDLRYLHSFPTRRSSDLVADDVDDANAVPESPLVRGLRRRRRRDRKSTRLNSSHANSSYAVFCLKKKSDGVSRAVWGAGLDWTEAAGSSKSLTMSSAVVI